MSLFRSYTKLILKEVFSSGNGPSSGSGTTSSKATPINEKRLAQKHQEQYSMDPKVKSEILKGIAQQKAGKTTRVDPQDFDKLLGL